jgi:hypothetical protein
VVLRRKPWVVTGLLAAASLLPIALAGPVHSVAANPNQHAALDCRDAMCAELANPKEAFKGYGYVGHDEPSTVFYSNRPGAGNQARYQLTLPTDPSASNPTAAGKSYNFELNPTFWFGMALCDTQSYPEQISTCPANSDSNILDPSISPKHAGTAFVEVQFYTPGWVPWPVWKVANGATTCDATKWCAAVNIFSLLEDPVAGTVQGDKCVNAMGGTIEPVNFAFITKNGVAQAPANPVQSTLTTFTPDPNKDLFMSSGDTVAVTMHDTAHGLQVLLDDKTSHQSGSMTASKENGFAQIKYDPNPATSCTAIPYDFHPMYSTSSEQTRVIWAAHTYNVAFSGEIGHFSFCEGPNAIPASQFGVDNTGAPIACPAGNTEERGFNKEPTDGDDNFCFPASMALAVHINGCTDTNTGFDGAAYQLLWPDGNTTLHPTSVLFSSPTTGNGYNKPYDRMAFEADLPRIEAADLGGVCDRKTGTGCTLIPPTDDGVAADFYPFFSITRAHAGGGGGGGGNGGNGGNGGGGGQQGKNGGDCLWQFGNHIPGSANDFGQNAQYGTLLQSTYIAFGLGGASNTRYNNFRQIINNPC